MEPNELIGMTPEQVLDKVKWETRPSLKWCIEIAAKAPYTTLAELFDRAKKIGEYCKEVVK